MKVETKMKNFKTPYDVCSFLNKILKLDPSVINQLFNYRVLCNNNITNHPTIQVESNEIDEKDYVGILGILNGLFGVNEKNRGYICMIIDDNNNIIKFCETKLVD